jgi:hypothetical protein
MTRRVSRQSSRFWSPALGAAFCLGLAACGTVDPDDPNRPTANPGPATKLLLGTADPAPLTPPVDAAIKRDCPPVEILDGAASHRVFEPGSSDPFSVRYQASIAETARECSNLGVEAGVRVGVVGRVILGPKGAPGTFRVPLRIAVLDEAGKPVYSQVNLIDVTVPPGESKADFTKIEDGIAVPIPANRFRGWRILVGYDPQPAEARTARGRR